jgi:hypothetical protein
VQQPVVVATEQHQVVEVGGASVGPEQQVVGVDVAGRAPGEAAAGAVAEPQGAALGTTDQSSGPA